MRPFVAFAAAVQEGASATRRFCRRLGRAIAYYWSQLDVRQLLRALPALLSLLTVAVLAFCCWLQSPATLLERYLKKAESALEARDYRTAQTCYQRLVVLAERNPEFLWGLFQATDAAGDRIRADALLNQLAPLDRQGYGYAHLHLARRLLNRQPVTAEDRRLAEVHLLWAAKVLPNSTETHFGLGRLYLEAGKPDLAEPHLLRAIEAHPEMHLPLAWLYVRQGARDKAQLHARSAQDYYQALTGNGPDNQLFRIHWAETKRLLDDYPGAIAILQRGLELTRNPLFAKALGQLYVAWFEAEARNPKSTLEMRLVFLERALSYDSENLNALNQLLALGRGGAGSGKGKAALEAALARGQSSAVVHLALGMDAWQRAESQAGPAGVAGLVLGLTGQGVWKRAERGRALFHLEQACKLSPRSALLVNNLAWMLARAPEPDLKRALELMDSVVQRYPEQPNLRDTRGQILAKMGRWREALVDLEIALRTMAGNRNLHRTLAEVYQQLDQPTLAAEHRWLAERKTREK